MTRNFTRKELECRCCGIMLYDDVFLTALQRVRDIYAMPMLVTSGTRCKSHNKNVGGSKTSDHMHGTGIDIVSSNSSDRYNLIRLALTIGFDRIGIGNGFLHLGMSRKAGKLVNDANVIWTY